jgi:hypothetical protein
MTCLRGLAVLVLFWLSPTLVFGCSHSDAFDESGAFLTLSDLSFSYLDGPQGGSVTTLGTITNPAPLCVEDIVLEVQYFDSAGARIDSATQPLYGVAIPSGGSAAFKVTDPAVHPKQDYASTKVRLVSVGERVTRSSRPRETPLPLQLLFNCAPILLLIAVWIFFMRRLRGQQAKAQNLTERQVVALERIASNLEKRNDREQGA